MKDKVYEQISQVQTHNFWIDFCARKSTKSSSELTDKSAMKIIFIQCHSYTQHVELVTNNRLHPLDEGIWGKDIPCQISMLPLYVLLPHIRVTWLAKLGDWARSPKKMVLPTLLFGIVTNAKWSSMYIARTTHLKQQSQSVSGCVEAFLGQKKRERDADFGCFPFSWQPCKLHSIPPSTASFGWEWQHTAGEENANGISQTLPVWQCLCMHKRNTDCPPSPVFWWQRAFR